MGNLTDSIKLFEGEAFHRSSMHRPAAVRGACRRRVEAHDRKWLEHLCRCITRLRLCLIGFQGALAQNANVRLQVVVQGQAEQEGIARPLD